MKRFTSFKHAVFATLLLSTTLTAFASGGGSAGRAEGLPIPECALKRWSTHGIDGFRHGRSSRRRHGFHRHRAGGACSNSQHFDGQVTGTGARGISGSATHGPYPIIPSGKTDYPPSAETIARNQVRFQQAAPFWRAHGDLPSQGQLASDTDLSK